MILRLQPILLNKRWWSPSILLIALPVIIFSEALLFTQCGKPAVSWQRVIETGTDESPSAILSDGDRIIVTGTQGKAETGRCVCFAQFLDRKGNLLGRRSFAEGRFSICKQACLDSNNNLLICGYAQPYETTLALVVKIDPQGKTIWKKGLVLGASTWANGITAPDTAIVICGGVQTGEKTDVFVARLDPDGKTRWSRGYHLNAPAEGKRVAADPKGNLTVLGILKKETDTDICILHLKPNGDTLWTRYYDSGGNDEPGGLAVDQFGNIVAVGTARLTDSVRCVILEYAPDGGAVRKVAYGENAQAEGEDVFITTKGEIFVVGSLIAPRGRQVLLYEYVPGATSIWERHITIGKGARGRGLLFDRDLFVVAERLNQNQNLVVLRIPFTREKK